ncbi:EamA family transporter [Chitinimonas sp.]|uniref:EamA family transporter n=1 Tax=Chitinimonas sp. TaxID=1934313 RepID=UPI0035AEFE04
MAASLFATWFIWGSTYLAIKLTLPSLPPMLGGAIRYLLAGLLMLSLARWRREPWPAWRETRHAAVAGGLALAIGNGAVCLGAQRAPSGLVALILAATPLFSVLINQLLGLKARPIEWLGVLLGLAGVGLIQQGASGFHDMLGLAIVLGGALAWAVSAVILPRLSMPTPLHALAIQMLGGGLFSLLVSGALGESWRAMPDRTAMLALLYLVFAGSLAGYSGYLWLLKHSRPALATSFFCVNPLVALGLGALWGGEAISRDMLGGIALVIAAVALVLYGSRPEAKAG